MEVPGIRTRVPRQGSNIKVSGLGREAGPVPIVRARIEGVEKTSQEFKDARRQFNTKMRDVIQAAGETSVLPIIKLRFKRKSGRFADSLFVRRDRTTVFIGSKMRGGENRAVGWVDFGGRHPLFTRRRKGLYVIVRTLEERQALITEAILLGLTRTFDPLEHNP